MNIVNLSLESDSFPDVLKVSHITPLIKKPSLSKDDMKNYRPVSNLNFISKMKIISNRIRSHLDKNNLSNPNQSAYKPLHSMGLLGSPSRRRQQYGIVSVSSMGL